MSNFRCMVHCCPPAAPTMTPTQHHAERPLPLHSGYFGDVVVGTKKLTDKIIAGGNLINKKIPPVFLLDHPGLLHPAALVIAFELAVRSAVELATKLAVRLTVELATELAVRLTVKLAAKFTRA